jgi:cell division septum initiation protein DivIVA
MSSVPTIPESIIASVVSLVLGVTGTWVVYKKQAKDHQLSLETRINDSMVKFQDRIEEEVKQTKLENEQLRSKVRDLEQKVSELLRINETVITEKLDWMQRAFILQAKLTLYEASDKASKEDVDGFVKEVTDLEGSMTQHEQ